MFRLYKYATKKRDFPLFKLRVLPLFIFLLSSLNVHANDSFKDNSGWYVGGVVTYASANIEVESQMSRKENAGSFSLYGGYNFTDWLGVEGALIRTGDISDNRDNLVKADVIGLSLMPKFTYRVASNFSVYAKAGLAWLSYDEEYDNVLLFERDTEESWSGLATNIGIGGQFDVIYGIKIRISFDRLQGDIGSNDETYYRTISDADVELKRVSLGAHYQF